MPYIGRHPQQAVRQRFYKTASGGETSLSGTMTVGGTLTFTDGNFVDVSLNGISLVAGTDYNTTTASSSAALTIDQFTMATYRSANYTVQVSDTVNGEYQTSLLNVVHNGSSVFFQEFGVTFTGSRQLATITADISGSTVRIRAVPSGSNTTVYKTFRTAIIV